MTERTVVIRNELFAGGFTAMPNLVLKNNTLSRDARLTYALLLSYAWQKDFCFPAQDRLAEDLGFKDTKPVRRYLVELRDSGLLSWKRQQAPKPCIYFLNAFEPDRASGTGLDRVPAPYKEDSREEHSLSSSTNKSEEKKERTIQEDSSSSEEGEKCGAGKYWVEDLVEDWNDTARQYGLTQVKIVSEARRRKAQEYLKQHPDLDFWQQVFANIDASPYLQGKKKPVKGWFDFDALIRGGVKDIALRIFEGTYADHFEEEHPGWRRKYA